jgi:hypothetical protein
VCYKLSEREFGSRLGSQWEVPSVDRRFVVLVGVAVRGRAVRLPSGASRALRSRWEPVGWVDDSDVANAMAELLREPAPEGEVRVVPTAELTTALGSDVAATIRDRLRNPTVVEVRDAHELELRAAERVRLAREAGEASRSATRERRSGADRRSGRDRRHADRPLARGEGMERRKGERRARGDRRRAEQLVRR